MQFLRQLAVLSKPRIVLLLVFTAACGLWKAAEGPPGVAVLAGVLVGGALAAAGANAINQALDADIDALMRRTRHRPVPSQRMRPAAAAGAGVVALVAACVLIWATANPLSALLTLAAAAVYVLAYTLILKRRSWNNIVIGGAAGAFPPLIAGAAVTGDVTTVGLYMFSLIFFWTPPHFWTLSLLLKEDYAAAGVPMLGSIASQRDAGVQVVLYIVLLLAMSWLPFAAGYSGLTFALTATALGVVWLGKAVALLWDPTYGQVLSAYKFSLVFLAGAFLVLAAEPVLPWSAV